MGHLGFGIRLEVAVRVLLRGNHLLQALFVPLEDLHLVGNEYLRADDHRKPQRREPLQNAWKRSIGEFLKARQRHDHMVDEHRGFWGPNLLGELG